MVTVMVAIIILGITPGIIHGTHLGILLTASAAVTVMADITMGSMMAYIMVMDTTVARDLTLVIPEVQLVLKQ